VVADLGFEQLKGSQIRWKVGLMLRKIKGSPLKRTGNDEEPERWKARPWCESKGETTVGTEIETRDGIRGRGGGSLKDWFARYR